MYNDIIIIHYTGRVKMIRKQIYLTEEIDLKTKRLAEIENVSQAEIIRNALAEYLEEKDIDDVQDPLFKMLGLIKKGESKKKESKTYDEYLYGEGING
jgi:hypothetical protein